MVQYNGYFGCSFCELKGERVQCTGKKKGSKTVFPMIKSKDLVLRSEERTMAQALLAIETNKTVNIVYQPLEYSNLRLTLSHSSF